MRKLVDIVSICIIAIVLLAINPIDYKADSDKPIQSYQPTHEETVSDVYEAKKDYFILKTTGYCPCEICCGEWANGKTFTGDEAGRGSIAIDPVNGPLKLGQKVFVEGYGYGVCNDIGGAITEWEADLCFSTHQEALEWGVRLTKFWVLEE